MPEKRLRILVDARTLLDANGAGVFEYARQLIGALTASGRYSLETWANAALPNISFRQAPAFRIDTRTRSPNKLLNASMRLFGVPRIESFASSYPDACWMPNLNFIALSPGTPLALTIHDLTFEIYPEFFSLKQRLWHRAVAPRALAARANVLLAVSETTKRDIIERWRVPPERVFVTHEGVDPSFFEAPSQAGLELIRKRHALPERFILHVGTLEPRKNHLGLLKAFGHLRSQKRNADLGLVLVGPPGWNNAGILRAIQQSPHRESIYHTGYVNAAERRGLYHLASVFAFPSFYEGFGLPPLEAMASGTPVVASHAGSLGELVENAGLLTDPYRPAEITDALAAVLDSSVLAERYIKRGYERAKLFSWNTCAKKTEAAFAAMRT